MIPHLDEAITFLQSQGFDEPHVGVVLGTGLGDSFVKEIENCISVNYKEIPGFGVATVESHRGKLLYGQVSGRNVVAMWGRFHYYEGYTMSQITFPIRVMKGLGVKQLLLSNAAGNLNEEWRKGDLMIIEDHINLQPDNPLRGANDDRLGVRFPDMSEPYSKKINESLEVIAHRQGLRVRKGVYASVMGPNLETRAEYKYLRLIGADAVGMSTVPEVIVANHAGIPCCAVSVLTDDCDPARLRSVKLEEIIAVARTAEPSLTSLFVELIKQL